MLMKIEFEVAIGLVARPQWLYCSRYRVEYKGQCVLVMLDIFFL